MLRQSPSRNHRSKKLRPSHSFQAFLLFAVGVWIVYQLTRSHGKRQAVLVETSDGDGMDDGEPARRRLGRKGFFGFTGHASDDGIIVGVERSAASDDDPLSKDADDDGVGDEEDQAADEDHGADDSDDGLAVDEEDEDSDSHSQNGNGEDELKTDESDRAIVFGNGDDDGTRLHEPKELNSSAVLRMNATGRVEDVAVSQQMNATDGGAAADRSSRPISHFALKDTPSVNLTLNDKGAESKKLNTNVCADDNRRISQTAESIGHGISR
ncbi:hypothetical protein EJB05_04262, partial [Eragrostis curvula]